MWNAYSVGVAQLNKDLVGLRILVVEDEGIVAMLVEDMLAELGCEVVGSVATLQKAIEAATNESFDFAMLDVNLDGQPVFPVAKILKSRQLPFLFSTGYGRVGIPSIFQDREVLSKPFAKEVLETTLRMALKNC